MFNCQQKAQSKTKKQKKRNYFLF